MVIRRGQDWGSQGRPAPSVPVALSDSQASRLIAEGIEELILVEGDMARTLGATDIRTPRSHVCYPIDVVWFIARDSEGNDSRHVALSHVMVCNAATKGGIFRGSVMVVCNSQYVHRLDLAPRGHPNDGMIEVLEFASQLSLRQRLQVFSRARNGSHMPHPLIRSRQIPQRISVAVRGVVRIDGVRIGERTILEIGVTSDAVRVWIATHDL